MSSPGLCRLRMRGLALREVVAMTASLIVLAAVLVPTLGTVRDVDDIAQSISNLNIIGAAHFTYAGDWDGRQWTMCPDNLTGLLHGGDYPHSYPLEGRLGIDNVPSAILGFDCEGVFHTARKGWTIQPFYFASNCSDGNHRRWQTNQFNQYVNGRVFDRTFWAPKDPTPKVQGVLEYFDLPCEWPGGPVHSMLPPSYGMAISAQFDPLVFANDLIGQTSPRDLPNGHRAPSLSQALYPDQKTFMLEHYWLQNPPSPFIPGAPGTPWYFNMGRDSVPVTLFYDGHVRLMPHMEAIRSDERVLMQGGPSLIASTDPDCFGDQGYFEWYGYEGEDVSSYHVFTADGILGRDTIFPE